MLRVYNSRNIICCVIKELFVTLFKERYLRSLFYISTSFVENAWAGLLHDGHVISMSDDIQFRDWTSESLICQSEFVWQGLEVSHEVYLTTTAHR